MNEQTETTEQPANPPVQMNDVSASALSPEIRRRMTSLPKREAEPVAAERLRG